MRTRLSLHRGRSWSPTVPDEPVGDSSFVDHDATARLKHEAS